MDTERHDKYGRTAEHPSDIPALGLRDVLWRVALQFSEDRITLVAAGVTYYALLAIFPGLSLFVSIYALFLDPELALDHAAALTSFFPAPTVEIFSDQLQSLASQRNSVLSFSVVASLLFALWSTHNGVLALFAALNAVYGEKEKRSFIKLNALGLLFSILSIFSVIVIVLGIAAVPLVLHYIWLGSLAEPLALYGRWPVLIVLAILISAILYHFGPSRASARLHWLSWGSVLTGVGWCVVSVLYSQYLQHFANFQATYGTLGALVGFMVWVWLSVIVLLIGAEINAELEHQTMIDTTTGSPEPMGMRGAYVADTVGKSLDEK